MPPAARVTDQVVHNGPHCHAPIHPPPPAGPTPLPHPPIPMVIAKGEATVMIANMPAARTTDMIAPCTVSLACIFAPTPGGMVGKGSATVMIGNMPAARLGDMCEFPGCVGPIPMPKGTISGPGAPTVMIGG